MPGTMTMDTLMSARGSTVYSTDGEKIGTVEEIYLDQETNKPEWIGLGAGFFGTKRVLVPVEGAELRDDGLYVPYSKDQVKGTPDVDMGSDEISQQDEAELYAHYGLGYSERRSETGLPEGAPGTERGRPGAETHRGRAEEEELVRTEEELKVGTRETEAGRARLRKWVETEPVESEVDVRREKARVTREPVDRPVSGGELGEQEVEVPLRQEEPVVEKQTVAKERIGLEKDVETQREPVREEVKKERVEVEGDVEEKKRR